MSCLKKNENWQKEAGDGLFKNKNIINNQSHEEKKGEKWLKVESGPSKRLEENECDQIWQIFATLGQRRKTLTLLKGLNLFLAKLRSCLGKFYMLLVKFSLLPMATKYLTKNLVIWSHWRERTWTDEGTVSLSLSLSLSLHVSLEDNEQLLKQIRRLVIDCLRCECWTLNA